MRAAANFRHGTIGATKDGRELPVDVWIGAGEELPTEWEIPDPDQPGKMLKVALDLESEIVGKNGEGSIPRKLILEFKAKENPEGLTREQLMQMAGVGEYSSDDAGEVDEAEHHEVTPQEEEDFREALQLHRTKNELARWSAEFLGIELDEAMTRSDMEEAAVDHWKSQR